MKKDVEFIFEFKFEEISLKHQRYNLVFKKAAVYSN